MRKHHLNTACIHYPFGMNMMGYSNPDFNYKYSFNGMEKDDEVKGGGNSLDFGARIYDSRLGRWLSIDKYSRFFPDLSPYNMTKNSPLIHIDSDGNFVFVLPIAKLLIDAAAAAIIAYSATQVIYLSYENMSSIDYMSYKYPPKIPHKEQQWRNRRQIELDKKRDIAQGIVVSETIRRIAPNPNNPPPPSGGEKGWYLAGAITLSVLHLYHDLKSNYEKSKQLIEKEKEKLGLERTEINSELSKLNPNNSKDQQRINQSNSRLAEIENLTNMANDDIQDYEVLINEADRVIQLESDAQRNQDFMNNLNQGRDKTNYVNPNIPPNDR